MPKRRPIIISACLHGAGNSREAANTLASRFRLTPQRFDPKKNEHIATTPEGKEVEVWIRGVNPAALRADPPEGVQELTPKEMDEADIVLTDYHTPHLLGVYKRPDLLAPMLRAKAEGRHHPLHTFFSSPPEERAKMEAHMRELLK